MFRRSVLIIAFVISLPVLWAALMDGSVSLEEAGIRYLIALPVATILVGLVRMAAHHGSSPATGQAQQGQNRGGDAPPGSEPSRPAN